ncbi:HMG box-containing protein 1 isoform X2 [Magallana gigas]|uniref:HMG box-containing protein 1 isoform X2 n=1 Tax=Magallana gigas TaxID=29159 RepID=UPI003342E1EF
MASVGPTHSKRPHVATERLKEFLNAPSPTKQKYCPVQGCSKVLSSDPGLRYHIQAHHSHHQEYVCSKCNRSFKSSNGLKYHLKKRAGHCQETEAEAGGKLSPTEEEGPTSQNQVETAPTIRRQSSSIPKPLNLIGQPSLSTLVTNDNVNQNEAESRLIEFANIATSPQSPLMQSAPPKIWDKSPAMRHIKFPDSNIPTASTVSSQTPRDDNGNYFDDGSDPSVTTTSPFPGCTSAQSNAEETWSHSWPKAVWRCFIKDTRVHFVGGSARQTRELWDWQSVEQLALQERIASQAAGADSKPGQSFGGSGLRLCSINKRADTIDNKGLRLSFSTGVTDQPSLQVECEEAHPFFVKDKGWSSINPTLTYDRYGIPCNVLSELDLCLPPDHPDANPTDDVFHTIQGFELTPQDHSAVFALSSMAKQKRDSDSTSSPQSGSGSQTKKRQLKEEEGKKPKRPMNAFLLFAKRHRVTLTQDHPGKDNRAISVILGEMWKNMKEEEKLKYEEEARVLAEKQKQKHPNCWKRKK